MYAKVGAAGWAGRRDVRGPAEGVRVGCTRAPSAPGRAPQPTLRPLPCKFSLPRTAASSPAAAAHCAAQPVGLGLVRRRAGAAGEATAGSACWAACFRLALRCSVWRAGAAGEETAACSVLPALLRPRCWPILRRAARWSCCPRCRAATVTCGALRPPAPAPQVRTGRDIAQAVMLMIPEAWQNDKQMSQVGGRRDGGAL